MKIDIDGEFHEFDQSQVGMNEAIAIQKRTGMLFPEWRAALQKGDALAWKALAVMLKERVGPCDFDSFEVAYDKVNPVLAVDEADASDPSPLPEPDAEPSSEPTST